MELVLSLGAGALLAVRGAHVGGRTMLHSHHTKTRLHNLTSDEKLVLKRFVASNTSTVSFLAGEVGADSLLRDGILFRAEDSHEYFRENGFFYYTINREAFKELRAHSDLVG